MGCEPGGVDGQWGKQAQSALDQFKKYKKIKIASEEVDEETLKLINLEQGRVCPLQCDDGEAQLNGQCVKKQTVIHAKPAAPRPSKEDKPNVYSRSNSPGCNDLSLSQGKASSAIDALKCK